MDVYGFLGDNPFGHKVKRVVTSVAVLASGYLLLGGAYVGVAGRSEPLNEVELITTGGDTVKVETKLNFPWQLGDRRGTCKVKFFTGKDGKGEFKTSPDSAKINSLDDCDTD